MCSMPYWSVWYDSSTHMWHDSSRRSNKNNNRTDGSFAKEPSLRLLFVWFFLHETCQICKRVIAPWPIRHATHVKVCCYTGEQMEKRHFFDFYFKSPMLHVIMLLAHTCFERPSSWEDFRNKFALPYIYVNICIFFIHVFIHAYRPSSWEDCRNSSCCHIHIYMNIYVNMNIHIYT